MNINFIGKDFEKLKEIDNYVNYEFEPKNEIKYGKRNIYFDELKQEFINDVNIYGFSPYIFETILEQRKNPNIKRYINKKFNYGYTNFITIKSKNYFRFSSRTNRKIKTKKKIENNKNKILKSIPQIFLIKKEKNKNKKLEDKGDFLKNALNRMSVFKLKLYEEEENKENENEKNMNLSNFKRRRGKNDFELMKDLSLILGKKERNKSQTFNNIDIFGNRGSNNIKLFIKPFFENIEKNLVRNQSEKNLITLTKNRYILGNNRLLSTLSNITKNSSESGYHYRTKRTKRNEKKVYSFRTSRNSNEEKKNNFLLLSKARLYKDIKNKKSFFK